MSFGKCPRYNQTIRKPSHSQRCHKTFCKLCNGYFRFHIRCIDIINTVSYIQVWTDLRITLLYFKSTSLYLREGSGKRQEN